MAKQKWKGPAHADGYVWVRIRARQSNGDGPWSYHEVEITKEAVTNAHVRRTEIHAWARSEVRDVKWFFDCEYEESVPDEKSLIETYDAARLMERCAQSQMRRCNELFVVIRRRPKRKPRKPGCSGRIPNATLKARRQEKKRHG